MKKKAGFAVEGESLPFRSPSTRVNQLRWNDFASRLGSALNKMRRAEYAQIQTLLFPEHGVLVLGFDSLQSEELIRSPSKKKASMQEASMQEASIQPVQVFPDELGRVDAEEMCANAAIGHIVSRLKGNKVETVVGQLDIPIRLLSKIIDVLTRTIQDIETRGAVRDIQFHEKMKELNELLSQKLRLQVS